MSQSSKIALITGAGSGIGKELAHRMALRGHCVFAAVRNKNSIDPDLQESLPNLHYLIFDVTRPYEITRAREEFAMVVDHLDILVNNAGFGLYGAFEELSTEDYRRQMETNYFGVLDTTRAFLPFLKNTDYANILNISSILGRITIPTGSPYCSSKWALEAFSETLRYELFIHGISVSLIEPGLIRTGFKERTVFTENKEDMDSPYRFLNRHMTESYSGFYTPVGRAAKKIARIAEKRRPALRYTVGNDAFLYNLLRRLIPENLLDRIFLRILTWKRKRSDRS